MSNVVVILQDPDGNIFRARCKHCDHRRLYSICNSDYDSSRFICLAQHRKFINGNGFACGFFRPACGFPYKILQSTLQLNLL